MNYMLRQSVNLDGQEVMMPVLDAQFYAERAVCLTGEITDEMATLVNAALRCLDRESDEDITLYIQSPGGSVTAGLSIYDTMRGLDSDVRTVACGMALSMAACLLAAGTPGKRFVQSNAEIMIHQPLGGIRGQASDISIHAQRILSTRAKLNRILARCTGRPIARIEQDTERDCYMDARAAVEYGLADGIEGEEDCI